MQLVQQLLAAILNVQAFGTSDGDLILNGKKAYCGTVKSKILASVSALDTFNHSGDNLTPAWFVSVSASPAEADAAEATADKGFWDTLP